MYKERVKPPYITAKKSIYEQLRELQKQQRKNPTTAERIMWEYLRNKKCGYRIRRQHIIDQYIVDFVCLRIQLIIEIDGEIHRNQREQDLLRTERLNELGYEVIRFTNSDVISNPKSVIMRIERKLSNMSSSASPLSVSGPLSVSP